MYLQRFDPSAIDPLFLVNRKDELDWLAGAVSDYLRDPDPKARGPLSFCILGEKGAGKTILTRAALRQARTEFSDRAIFVEADCRRFRSARAVIDAIAKNVVEALDDLKRAAIVVSNELVATANVLAMITRFEDAELNIVHQHLVQFKAATGLKGERSLLREINLSFNLSLDLSTSTSRQLSGKVRFDEMRLCQSLAALFEDIRRCDIDVVLYIDNMDELSHDYKTEDERKRTRRDTEVLLALHTASIVSIFNMRTYYGGILPREIANRRVLRRMPPPELLRILEKRLEPVHADVKRAVETPAAKETIAKIAQFAPTPLAFLTWFKVLFEDDALAVDKLDAGTTRFLEAHYSTLPVDVLRSVVAAFAKPDERH